MFEDNKPEDAIICAGDDDVRALDVVNNLTGARKKVGIFEVVDRYAERTIVL